MRYISTRGGIEPVAFREALMMGLARDGGLILPERYPDVSGRLAAWRGLSYAELAFEIMRLYATDIPEAELRRMVGEAYATFDHPEVTPVRKVGDLYILELFHGPTLAFKDVALQMLGRLFEYQLEAEGGELNIVAATSGDTGSAAIHGVRGRKRQRIFVMHPAGKVSPVQEMQMTSVTDDNVFNLAVSGTFDDCQDIVKTLFRDLAFRDAHRLGAVNSINWARVMAQVTYYFYAAFRAQEATECTTVNFTVPTGNFGDIFAGYVAVRMGLPVSKLLLATNENDILARFFQSGEYALGKVHQSLSPSMDIQIASNFERYLYHRSGDDAALLTQWMETFAKDGKLTIPHNDALFEGGRGDTAMTLAAIKDTYERHGYLLDPHTAVGVSVAQTRRDTNIPMICLATAHPAKFPDAIAAATGQAGLATHPSIEALRDKPRRCTPVPADAKRVADYLRRHIYSVLP